MTVLSTMRVEAGNMPVDNERALLGHLDLLLEREEQMMAARDAAGLVAVAAEREATTARLSEVALARRTAFGDEAPDQADEAELARLYRSLRVRHAIRAMVLARHAEHCALAVGVLAQASGRPGLYDARGRVPMQFASA